MDYSEEIMKIQEYGMQLNELRNAGVKEISLEQHQQLLEYYIEALRLHEKSSQNFNDLLDILGIKVQVKG